MHSIANIGTSRKVHEAFLISAVALMGISAFGLGRLSAPDQLTAVALCDGLSSHTIPTTNLAAAAAPVASSNTLGEREVTSSTAHYVASKNGTVYHLPWCAGAQRIKDANKVWFASKEEAEAAGYRPASNCKGI